MRVLVTRPWPDNERTAQALRARGHEALMAPMLRVAASPDAEFGPPPFSAIVATSANALRAIAAHPRKTEIAATPLFAVGARTRDEARAQGFAQVESADGDVAALAALLRARLTPRMAGAPAGGTVLYLAGEDRTGDLAAMLAGDGVAVRTVVVYRAMTEHAFPGDVAAALAAGGIDAVLHYSVRTAAAFVAAAKAAGFDRALAEILHACLSETIAATLRAAGAARIAVAATPREADLLATLGAPP